MTREQEQTVWTMCDTLTEVAVWPVRTDGCLRVSARGRREGAHA